MSLSRSAAMALATAFVTLAAAPAMSDPPAAPAAPARALQFDRLPNGADVSHYYPTRAQFEGVEGRAVIGCQVGADGALAGCTVVSETPPDYGFGTAVLSMAGLFHVNMRTATAGTNIRLPLTFHVSEGETPTVPRPVGSVLDPAWTAQPSAADLAAGAPASREGGRAIMDCVFTAEGTLSNCAVVSQLPVTGGFGDAAVAVAPRYRVAPVGADGVAVAGKPVRVPVIFPRSSGRH